MSQMPAAMIDLCTIADEGYFMPTAVMLTSVKCNKKPGTSFRVHVIALGNVQIFHDKLHQLSSEDFEIIFHEPKMAEEQFAAAAQQTYVSRAALLKFGLGNLLPDLDKVLYLDGDIIVRQDLAQLWSYDVTEVLMAAVPDVSKNHDVCELGTQRRVENYVNTGVLLLNLSRMRAENTASSMLAVKLEHPEWRFMDQDAINVICAGRKRLLPFRYNAVAYQAFRGCVDEVNDIYGTLYTRREEMEDDMVIIHLAGPHKPWSRINAPYADLWMKYYNLSPYGNTVLSRSIGLDAALGEAIRTCLWIYFLRLVEKLPLHSVETQGKVCRIRFCKVMTLMKAEERVMCVACHCSAYFLLSASSSDGSVSSGGIGASLREQRCCGEKMLFKTGGVC